MYQSHESLKRDFEVTTKELDSLVAIARTIEGVYGCRMTGGGFGGCTVALVASDKAESARGVLAEKYAAQAKLAEPPLSFVTVPGGGARVLEE